MKRYFANTGDIFARYDTAEEAKQAAEADLQAHREHFAGYCNIAEDNICWGEIRGIVAETADGYELQDVPRPEPPKLAEIDRKALRSALRSAMSEISEAHCAAGWAHRLEFDLWDAVQRLPTPTCYVDSYIERDVEFLRDVSSRLGEWCDFRRFIPLAEWLKIVEADKKRS